MKKVTFKLRTAKSLKVLSNQQTKQVKGGDRVDILITLVDENESEVMQWN